MGVINQLNYHKCAINPIKSTISYGFLWSNGGTTSKTYKNDGTNPVDPMDPKASCVGGSHHVQSAGHLTKRTTFGPQNDRMLRSHSYIKTNHGHTHMYMCIYIYKCICIYIYVTYVFMYIMFLFFSLCKCHFMSFPLLDAGALASAREPVRLASSAGAACAADSTCQTLNQ